MKNTANPLNVIRSASGFASLTRKLPVLFSFLSAFLFLCELPPAARAATYTYGSNGTTNWSTATWTPGVPASSLDNIISITNPNGQPRNTTNNLGAGFQLNSLNLTNNTTTTNPQTLSVAGNSLNFVKDSSNVLPTLTLAKANGTSATSTITVSAPWTVTDALTISSTVGGGPTSIQGAITNTGGITFTGTGAGAITLGSGVVSGGGGITVNGSYNVNMTGNNSYTGLTNVQSGTLTLNRSGGVIASTAAVEVNGGTLNVAQSDTVGAVTLSSGTISGAGVLTGSSYSLTNTGTISAALAGSGVALSKNGAGTVTLSGTSTYTGTTTVSTGTLIVNGSLGNTAVTVASGAFLGGSGSFGGTVDIQGTHNPGNSPGVQTFSDLSYSGGASVVNWELKSNTTTNVANPNAVFDSLIVNGNLDFAAATSLNLSFVPGGSDVLWSDTFWDSSKTGTAGWLLYDVAGVTTGFGNLNLTSSNWLDSGGNTFSAELPGSSFSLYQAGNDIYLNYTAVPEPSGCSMFGAGILGLAFLRRFRRKI